MKTRKSICANFIDPVPPNHKYKKVAQPIKVEPPIENPAESDKNQGSPPTAQALASSNGEFFIKKSSRAILVKFFNGICPEVLFKPEGCDNAKCAYSTHVMPDADHLTKLLEKSNIDEVETVYKLLESSLESVRDKFLDVFIGVFLTKGSMDRLRMLIFDRQKSPTIDFKTVVGGLVKQGWNYSDAVQLIIDNHEKSKAAEKAIVTLIGYSGSEIRRFTEYLLRCRE